MPAQTLQRKTGALGKIAMILVAGLLSTPVSAAGDLYKELGGINSIERITSAVLDHVYADERIAFLFEGTDREYLHERVVEQICVETGGPCRYKGLPMERVHGGLDLRHNEFEAFVEDFILGMEDAGISYRLQNRVLKIFAPMRKDIVYQ